MSLNHLGRFSEPVFDALLPVNGNVFPVARRVVSHAARSLFAGKLLFPVSMPGKEGQHCFSADPKRLFRMPPGKPRLFCVLPPVVSRMPVAIPPISPGKVQARQHIEMRKSSLPSCTGMKTQTFPGMPSPDLSLAEMVFAAFAHPSRFPSKGFREPLFLHQSLLSRFEILRMRRMAPASEPLSLTKPPAFPKPPAIFHEVWKWFAWSSKIGTDKPACIIRTGSAASLSLPRPPLLTPKALAISTIPSQAWSFLFHQHRRGDAWRPPFSLPFKTFPFFASPQRHTVGELLTGVPALAIKDHDTYISLHTPDAPVSRHHLILAEFSHVHCNPRPAVHTQIQPVLNAVERLAGPSIPSAGATSILANIPKSRLAEIRGMPEKKMFRRWPNAVFLPLRQLLFRKPFAKKFDFQDTHPLEFLVFATRFFSALKVLSGSLDTAPSSQAVSSRAKPFERRLRTTFDFSSKHRIPSSEPLNAPTAQSTAIRPSHVRPSPVFSIDSLARKGVKLPLRHSLHHHAVNHAHFELKDDQRVPFKPVAQPRKQAAGTTGMVFPPPSMLLLGLDHEPRGPEPLVIPRRLAPVNDPDRMIRLVVSLPRRSHSTRHYQLSLESSTAMWKQHPLPRRTRFPSDRESFPHESPAISRIVQLSEDFRTVSAWRERAFAFTGVTVSFSELHDPDLSAMSRIDRGRAFMEITPPLLPATVAGAQFLDTPEWIRATRQAKVKIRYWPSFYGFPAPLKPFRMWLSLLERAPMATPEISPSVVPPAGPFNIRRYERPRGPFSMRRPKRWLMRSDPESVGIPDVYYHENLFPTSTPSRLDSAERLPPAFMGPAFREPWYTIASAIEHIQFYTSETVSLPSPELMAHCRASTRPALVPAIDFEEVPMPRFITTARHSAFSPPGESLEIRFKSQQFKPIGPLPASRGSEPFHDVRLATLRQVETFIEIRPDLFSGEFQEAAGGGEFFIRDLSCDLIIHHGGLNARWRTLLFPYKPDLRGVETVTPIPVEPDPATMTLALMEPYGAILSSPGSFSPTPDRDDLPPYWTMTAKGFAPDHPRQESFNNLPVLVPESGFDILEAPAAPAQESDFFAYMFVPFIATPAEKSLNDAEKFEPAGPSFVQADSGPLPAVSYIIDKFEGAAVFPSIEQPTSHSIITAGRWIRKLPFRATYMVPHTPPADVVYSPGHSAVLPPLQASSFGALNPVGAPAHVIACHEKLEPRDSHPARLTVSSTALPPLAMQSSRGTTRQAEILPWGVAEKPVFPLRSQQNISLPAVISRISCMHQELSFKFHPQNTLRAPDHQSFDRSERQPTGKVRNMSRERAAIHMPAYPDWLELSSTRPACRPPIGL